GKPDFQANPRISEWPCADLSLSFRFFYIFFSKGVFMLTNGTTYQTATRLDRVVGFELLVMCCLFHFSSK
ncbi:MAG: hypothetical protein SOY02_04255, partial [Candidatus Onthovivens sp.]|nr:hypothetical protein [Candidatus Onthovivens sp.]